MTENNPLAERVRTSTVVEFTLPTAEFVLAETLRAVPSATFEIIRLVAHDADRAFPYLWVFDDDIERVDDALADELSIPMR
ncbi:hypothetical protein BG842_17625 [Haladaptatus sp. W1]|uniref:hypothetical protein n=1 Tax=Haladaptatus sp. W1 TaxID=1897478 RepID=UPI0008498D4D|nr:hypothetical protein [Haladaptatus sp. W1]ODR82881.1 hypothetical protein BG842_17625 [Haladaptatus sp. W1]